METREDSPLLVLLSPPPPPPPLVFPPFLGAIRSSSLSMRNRFFAAGAGDSAGGGCSGGRRSFVDSMLGLLETGVRNQRCLREAARISVSRSAFSVEAAAAAETGF